MCKNVQLKPKQKQAIKYLAQGHSFRSCAGLVGVNEHTVGKWWRSPEFRAALDAELDDVFAQAMAVIIGGAVDVAIALLDQAKSGDRFAAVSFLYLALRGSEYLSIDRRLRVLETPPAKEDVDQLAEFVQPE